MAGESPQNEFVREFREQMTELRGEVSELKESIEGDPRNPRWLGISARLTRLEDDYKKHEKLLDAWQRDQDIQAAVSQRRERLNKLFFSGVSLVAVVLSILVAATQLAGVGG